VNPLAQTGRGRPASEHRDPDVDGSRRVEGRGRGLHGHPGQKPRYIVEDKCTGCTTCVEYCPVNYPDPFNQELSQNKAVHIYFPRPSPWSPTSTRAAFTSKRKSAGSAKASARTRHRFHQTPEKMEIKVGAIVLAPGFEPFDPKVRGDYGYGRLPNVVTSMDFERLLCATGPLRRRDPAPLRPQAPPQDRLDPMRRLPAGHPGRQQLLLGGLLHLHPEAGDPGQGPRRGGRVHHLPQRHPLLRQGFRALLRAGREASRGALHPQLRLRRQRDPDTHNVSPSAIRPPRRGSRRRSSTWWSSRSE
jgi:NAD-dependent dihydropyrimidine dehydrogenase PreA subunit